MTVQRVFISLMLVLCLLPMAQAQAYYNYPPDNKSVVIDSTNLPIVWIDVDGVMIQK